jgi:uncharacterized protein (DUF362 family)
MLKNPSVAIVRYERAYDSLQNALELSAGFEALRPDSHVFIKPNICFWVPGGLFPKWGSITTSRIVHDCVRVLKDRGVKHISIGEGMVLANPKDIDTPAEAFSSLGYRLLQKRYGTRVFNVFERPFEHVDFGDGIELNVNTDYLHADFVINLPVLKTHRQTVVSLGIKNLKGLIDVRSRKVCHRIEPDRDLHSIIARLHERCPPGVTVIDGIYSNEMGPSFDGELRRSDVLVASTDTLSADFVGARLLGYDPADVPHLAHAARRASRPTDLSDIVLEGLSIDEASSFHRHAAPYDEKAQLPESLARMGIEGLSIPRYDVSACTFCAILLPQLHHIVAQAWQGEPWDDIEILSGKSMKPTSGKGKTILLGKCMYQAHKNSPEIKEMLAVKGCPPNPDELIEALTRAGLSVNPHILHILRSSTVFLMHKYAGRPEFDASHFLVELPHVS